MSSRQPQGRAHVESGKLIGKIDLDDPHLWRVAHCDGADHDRHVDPRTDHDRLGCTICVKAGGANVG